MDCASKMLHAVFWTFVQLMVFRNEQLLSSNSSEEDFTTEIILEAMISWIKRTRIYRPLFSDLMRESTRSSMPDLKELLESRPETAHLFEKLKQVIDEVVCVEITPCPDRIDRKLGVAEVNETVEEILSMLEIPCSGIVWLLVQASRCVQGDMARQVDSMTADCILDASGLLDQAWAVKEIFRLQESCDIAMELSAWLLPHFEKLIDEFGDEITLKEIIFGPLVLQEDLERFLETCSNRLRRIPEDNAVRAIIKDEAQTAYEYEMMKSEEEEFENFARVNRQARRKKLDDLSYVEPAAQLKYEATGIREIYLTNPTVSKYRTANEDIDAPLDEFATGKLNVNKSESLKSDTNVDEKEEDDSKKYR
eukprot:GHVH01014130.1.p1 GENE.GHVH01014130.1~~GHVH01014130.1.p1  ORF type:complete len:365 (+),score=64.52 GHVH01014130.1:931-2025(+)